MQEIQRTYCVYARHWERSEYGFCLIMRMNLNQINVKGTTKRSSTNLNMKNRAMSHWTNVLGTHSENRLCLLKKKKHEEIGTFVNKNMKSYKTIFLFFFLEWINVTSGSYNFQRKSHIEFSKEKRGNIIHPFHGLHTRKEILKAEPSGQWIQNALVCNLHKVTEMKMVGNREKYLNIWLIWGLSQNRCSFSRDKLLTPSTGILTKRTYSVVHYLSNNHLWTSVCQVHLELQPVLQKQLRVALQKKKKKKKLTKTPMSSLARSEEPTS